MGNGLSLLSVLTLLGAAHGMFLAFTLIKTKSGDITAHRILSLFTFLLALDLGEEFLYQTGFFRYAPDLLQVLAPLDLLYGPVLFLYITHLTAPGIVTGRGAMLIHLVLAPVAALLHLPFYFYLNGSEKLQFVESMRTGGMASMESLWSVRMGITIFGILAVVQIGVYLLLCIRRVSLHYDNIKQEYSDLEKINLVWLRNLLLSLTLIYCLYLGDQFFPDLFGINLFGDAITVFAVILIYAMGYFGLRQPRIFTQSPKQTKPSSETVSDLPEPTTQSDSARYKKSGLDKETSQSFLVELTSHMEENKPYLEGGLSLPQLAEQLGITPNYLSQIINEQRQLNFYDFINHYRVEEAKHLICTEDNPNILQIAFNAGFNSKSAFYLAFKKATGITPTQFKKKERH